MLSVLYVLELARTFDFWICSYCEELVVVGVAGGLIEAR